MPDPTQGRRWRRKLLPALIGSLGLSGTVLAQSDADAGARSATGDTDERLEHILVYGEKLKRPYLETFSSVGIVTAEDLDDYDIADTSDAYKRLANVRAFSQGAGSKSIAIRGLNADGVTQPSNSAALISVVIDGVTQSAEGLKRGSRGLWDVEQLEVHRGPQGTTQGRNALAGTVNIKTQDPTFEPEYKFRALYGELERKEVAGAVSMPLIKDQLAFRLSGEYAEKTADIDFTDPANKIFAEDEYHNIRGKLLYTPKSLDGLEVLLTVSDIFDAPASSPVSGPDFYDREFAASSQFAEKREMNLQNYNLDIGYALGNGMVLRSITGYNDTDLEITSVPSAADVFFRQDNRMDGDFMQEFRLEMNEEIAGLTGVAGLFYGDFDQHSESYILYYQAFPVQDGTFDNSTETWAAYADFRYRLTDSLSLLFGGRYQDDTVRNQADIESALSGGSQYDLESGFDVFLPKAGLSLDITDNQTLAATASRGYRQGFAERRLGSEGGLVDVDPEFVWAYEIAYRISALNNRLLLGANVFYNDYTDQQITVTNPDFAPLTNTLNAGDSESWGAEIEAQYAFDNGLRIYGSLGLLETELGDFPAEDCINGSCEGNQYSEAPEVTASLGGEYRHDSGFFASLASSYTDSFYRSVDNADDLEVDSSFVVDAKVGYDFGHVRVSAYANNLFDEEYLTGISNANSAFIGDPRAMGVEVSAEF